VCLKLINKISLNRHTIIVLLYKYDPIEMRRTAMRSRPLDWTALTIVIIGAINWGLIGLFRFDLIATLFGGMESAIARVLYVIVGLAGLYCLSLYMKMDNETRHRHTEHVG